MLCRIRTVGSERPGSDPADLQQPGSILAGGSRQDSALQAAAVGSVRYLLVTPCVS